MNGDCNCFCLNMEIVTMSSRPPHHRSHTYSPNEQGRPLTARFSYLSEEEEATAPPPEPLDPAETADVIVPGLELVEVGDID